MMTTFLNFYLPPYKSYSYSKRCQLKLFCILSILLYAAVKFDMSIPIVYLLYIIFSIEQAKIKFHIWFKNDFLEAFSWWWQWEEQGGEE